MIVYVFYVYVYVYMYINPSCTAGIDLDFRYL